MSDGGAKAVFDVGKGLLTTRLGRLMLLVGAGYCVFLELTNVTRDRGIFLMFAVLLGLVAAVGGGLMFLQRRAERSRPSAMKLTVLVGFALVATVAIVFGVFMLLKRRKALPPADVAVPDVAELELLAREEVRQLAA